jgi:hypothetical protein
MGRNGLFGNFQGLDAFGKVSIHNGISEYELIPHRQWKMSRSARGPVHYVRPQAMSDTALIVVTFISFSIILTSVMLEFVDYRRVHLEPSILVDRSRGEKLVIEMDISFPRVPCYRKLSQLLVWRIS